MSNATDVSASTEAIDNQRESSYSESGNSNLNHHHDSNEWTENSWGHQEGNHSGDLPEWSTTSNYRNRSGSYGKFNKYERHPSTNMSNSDRKYGRDRSRDHYRSGYENHWKGRGDSNNVIGIADKSGSSNSSYLTLPYDGVKNQLSYHHHQQQLQQQYNAVETRNPENSSLNYDHQPTGGDTKGFRQHRNYNNEFSSRNYHGRHEGDEPISTIYTSGFPDDVKERELRNMARFLPGFEGCTLFRASQQTVGFIKFLNHHDALHAIEMLHNIAFDITDREYIISATLAKRNMMTKNRNMYNPEQYNPNDFSPQYASPTQNRKPLQPTPSSYSNKYPRTTDLNDTQIPYDNFAYSNNQGMNYGYKKRRFEDEVKPECDTLCIRNIPTHATERDLGDFQEFVAKVDGYRLMNMVKANNGATLAFVRLVDSNASIAAMQQLQGYFFRGCRHPISVQYAKRSLDIPI